MILLSFDYALRTNKEILALTLLDVNNNAVIPQSLLNLHSMKQFNKKRPEIPRILRRGWIGLS